MICKPKDDGNLGIWKKNQGSTYVVTTTGVTTIQLGGGRQLQVVTQGWSLMNPTMCHLYWNRDGCDGDE